MGTGPKKNSISRKSYMIPISSLPKVRNLFVFPFFHFHFSYFSQQDCKAAVYSAFKWNDTDDEEDVSEDDQYHFHSLDSYLP